MKYFDSRCGECFCSTEKPRPACQCPFVEGVAEISEYGLIACNEHLGVLFINRGIGVFLGYSVEQARAMTLGQMLSSQTMESCRAVLKDLQAPGNAAIPPLEEESSLFALRSDGAEIPVSISVSFVVKKGFPLYTFLLRDDRQMLETERQLKESLHEKDLLLKEVHHRVKNNLQVISSLLNLQNRHTSELSAALAIRESQNRIKAIALIYEMLYQHSSMPDLDFGKYLQKLAGSLLRSYRASSRVELDFNLQDIRLPVDSAVPAGLVANELLSNCVRHGIPEPRSGVLTISLSASKDELFFLRVSDSGRGFKNLEIFEKVETLGARLVGSLVKQLAGELRAYNDDGAVVEVVCKQKG